MTAFSSRALLTHALGLVLTLAAGCGGGSGGGAGATGSAGAGATGASTAPVLAPQKSKVPVVIDREGEGFLEDNRVFNPATGQWQSKLFAHVKGGHREMGRQYGALLGARLETILQVLPVWVQSQRFPAWILPSVTATTALIFRDRFPAEVKEYIRGVIEGNRQRRPSSFMTEDDLYFLSSLVDLGGITNGIVTCSTVAVWGPIAKDGKMFQTRCVDLFTGSGLEDQAVVVIEKGTGKIPWANAGWAGMIGSASGMNAHGVATGQVWAFSENKAFGEPWVLTTRRIMENAMSSDEAVQAFRAVSERTYGSNFVFGDKGDLRGGVPKAWALESSAHYLAVFEDNDPKEDLALWNGPNGPEPYAIKIPFCTFRGDVCLDPDMRRRSTGAGGPNGDPRNANSYRARYKGQSDRVLDYINAGTAIGAQELIELTRGVATRGGSLQCVVYANSDLELWVADSRRDPSGTKDAFEEPYGHFDFDYYLPTIHASLDRPGYQAGDAQAITIATSTLGSDRDLELELSIEGPGGAVHFHTQGPARHPLAFRRGQSGAVTYGLDLPYGLPLGAYKLRATLVERGTSDLVDVSLVSFQIQ